MSSALFVNSLPKSGTNLVAKLLSLMGARPSGVSISGGSIHGRHAFLKRLLRGGCLTSDVMRVGVSTPGFVRSAWVRRKLLSTPPGAFATGHMLYSDAFFSAIQAARLRPVVVVRDPRDVVVSCVNYMKDQRWHPAYSCYQTDLESGIRYTLYGGQANGVYSEGMHSILAGFSPWMHRCDVLVVRFEDLVGVAGGGDKELQLKSIAELADWAGLSEFNLAQVADELFGGTHTFRRGKIGQWRSLDKVLRDEVSNMLAPYVTAWGYEL